MGSSRPQVPRSEIERAQRYASALQSFLCGCTTSSVDSQSRATLVEIRQALARARACIDEILAANAPVEGSAPPAPEPEASPPSRTPAPGSRSAQPPPSESPTAEGAIAQGPAGQRVDVVRPPEGQKTGGTRRAGAGLVLKDSETEPCFQEFQGRRELSPDTVAKLDAFASEQQLEMTEQERRRFLQKVQRWIETTPEGQVLTIRVSDLHGALKPYPQYRPDPDHKPAPGG